MKKRAGDTLVEVALAVGIFSMIAITVVAVMVSSTSSAQTALETTLAREEIDTQAEALRFIHSAYLEDEDSGYDTYSKIWKDIANIAIIPNPDGTNEYLNYPPSTCQEVLESDVFKEHGFVIDPHALRNNPVKALVRYKYNSTKFTIASTYPHLIYTENDELVDEDSADSNLYRAEGIYVIAVKDSDTTQIVNSVNPTKSSGFYDFYIRTCWYGAGSKAPSVISTVIRLYNPPDID